MDNANYLIGSKNRKMKETLKQGQEKKRTTKHKISIWGAIGAFKKSIKDKQRYCIRIIKKMVGRWK